MSLNEFKDNLAKETFGMTKAEARAAGLCIHCKKEPKFYSYNGRKEYEISGLCEFCFDDICDPDKCKNCKKPESFHIHKPNLGECNNFELDPNEFGIEE